MSNMLFYPRKAIFEFSSQSIYTIIIENLKEIEQVPRNILNKQISNESLSNVVIIEISLEKKQ